MLSVIRKPAARFYSTPVPLTSILQKYSFSADEKAHIEKFIRVDQAGELGADRIYAGQHFVLGRTPVGPLIKHMWDQEKVHLGTFNTYVQTYQVRPTVLAPMWSIAGFVLGAGSALLGKEAAMACTVAVETVIGEHYNAQLRKLIELRAQCTTDPEKFDDMITTISKFRDDELEHLQTGIDHDAYKTPFYTAIEAVITGGCKVAIKVAERI